MSGKLKFDGEIRDPIHGLIPLTKLEFKIIDTIPFQRLRNIKQLALASLGFHGANHTRFEHSIGVMHVASKIVTQLINKEDVDINSDIEQNIRLAGLLHDIGHGPFSHISEYLLDYYSRDNKDVEDIEEIHEEISKRIITENKAIFKILGEDRAKAVSDILKTENPDLDFKHDVVSGPLDGDKMDYLLRDSYYAGVKYGIFDLERLINVLTVVDENKQKRLALRLEGIQTAEQYVIAKYFITQQVYQHKTRHITDIMIVEGIKNAIESGNNKIRKLYNYKNNREYINYYLTFNDNKIADEILSNIQSNTMGFKYFDMLARRILLKRLCNCKVPELIGGKSNEAHRKLQNIKDDNYCDLKQKISKQLKLDQDFTHVKIYSLKDPLIQRNFV